MSMRLFQSQITLAHRSTCKKYAKNYLQTCIYINSNIQHKNEAKGGTFASKETKGSSVRSSYPKTYNSRWLGWAWKGLGGAGESWEGGKQGVVGVKEEQRGEKIGNRPLFIGK